MTPKPIYLSRTFWFNLLAFLVLIANAFGFLEFQPAPEVNEYAAIVISLVNIAMRLLTRRPVTLTP